MNDELGVNDAMLSYAIVPTLSNSEAAAASAYKSALEGAGLDAGQVSSVVSTGYGALASTLRARP